jgi:hypothetical protein
MAPRSAPRIDCIGDNKQSDQQIKQRRRIVTTHVARKAAAGDPADVRADQLNRDHERVGKQLRPTQAEAELRAGLGIGGYAAGVVVRGAGDQAGAHYVAELRTFRLLDLV